MDYNTKLLVAIEGFLRNASYIDAPFMVKGSIVTRQLFPNPAMRYVQDLDWVCLEYIDRRSDSRLFSKWVIEVTESNEDKKVWFKSFRDNNFWRMIDYAMDDDFPTTNTDLYCIIDEEGFDDLSLDISFNLDIDFPPEKLLYKPLFGEPFQLEKVCPYCLQVSWKLHQLLVRPRLKDVFDLIFLLRHERFNKEELEKIMYALKKECKRDEVNVESLVGYIDGSAITKVKPQKGFLNAKWNAFLRNQNAGNETNILQDHEFTNFTSKEYFPYKRYSDVLVEFQEQLIKCGFTEKIIAK